MFTFCISKLRRSWELIFSGFEVLDSTTKPPNMNLQLLLSSKIELIVFFHKSVDLTKESAKSLYNWDFSVFNHFSNLKFSQLFHSKKIFSRQYFFSKYFLGNISPLKSSKIAGELQTPPGTSRTNTVSDVRIQTKNVSKSMVLVQALLRSIIMC